MKTNMHGHAFVKWALVAGIVIVLNLFFNYALSLVYPEPAWEDYFGRDPLPAEYYDEDSCLGVGGKWYPPAKAAPSRIDGTSMPVPEAAGWCDPNYTKQMEFEAASDAYDRNAFLILVVLGAASIAAGALLAHEVLALGFSWGGVLSLVVASMRYWNAADKLVKVLILLAALAGLIWVALKKFKN